MTKFVKENVIFTHDLIMKAGSKIYMTGVAAPYAFILGYTREELEQMPGQHIEGDLVLEENEILVVDGNVLGMHGGTMKGGCSVQPITKDQYALMEKELDA